MASLVVEEEEEEEADEKSRSGKECRRRRREEVRGGGEEEAEKFRKTPSKKRRRREGGGSRRERRRRRRGWRDYAGARASRRTGRREEAESALKLVVKADRALLQARRPCSPPSRVYIPFMLGERETSLSFTSYISERARASARRGRADTRVPPISLVARIYGVIREIVTD